MQVLLFGSLSELPAVIRGMSVLRKPNPGFCKSLGLFYLPKSLKIPVVFSAFGNKKSRSQSGIIFNS
jgi:hypothetical protein